MSYILDALRKADAERERGHVPSIHAQTVLPGTAPAGVARAPRVGWWIALGAVVLVAAVGLTWWLVGASAPRNAATLTAAAPSPSTATPVSAPAPVPAPAASVIVPAPVAPAPPHAATPKPKPKPAPSAPAVAAAPATTAPAPVPAAPSGTEPLTGKVYAINELPDAIRSQLPNVAVSSSMYSPVRANRMLIVNGQVLHEGDKITPELVLEQVRVKAAVLVFRGYRYTLPF